MSLDVKSPAPDDLVEEPQETSPDPSLEDLRRILLRDQAGKVEGLEAGLESLRHQVSDEGALVKMIAPVLGEAIRLKIHEARDEMIEALYPIIGQVVQRAVVEAVGDLARSLDAQVKSSFDLRLAWWRLRARLSGASQDQIRLRELLPFSVTDILLIHRETGLLLAHLCGEGSRTSDTDLFSGMLTAIRDFSQDMLGGEETGLGEIGYGGQSILIETARHAYLAVILNGIAPPQFRAAMRERLIEIEHSHAGELRNYQGEARPLASVESALRPLLVSAPSRGLSTAQKRFLAGGLALLVLFLAGCGLLTSWAWQAARQTPAPRIIYLLPAPTLTPAPSSTPTLTATPTSVPGASPSPTALPATPVVGVVLGNVWMHTGPAPDTARTGGILTRGEEVEILAVDGRWALVRRLAAGQDEAGGWIPVRWLGVTSPIPGQLITPGAAP